MFGKRTQKTTVAPKERCARTRHQAFGCVRVSNTLSQGVKREEGPLIGSALRAYNQILLEQELLQTNSPGGLPTIR